MPMRSAILRFTPASTVDRMISGRKNIATSTSSAYPSASPAFRSVFFSFSPASIRSRCTLLRSGVMDLRSTPPASAPGAALALLTLASRLTLAVWNASESAEVETSLEDESPPLAGSSGSSLTPNLNFPSRPDSPFSLALLLLRSVASFFAISSLTSDARAF